MSKITLRIIAEATGLSKYAVSRALAGKSGVSAATRLKVAEAAERLGYRRSAGAAANVLGAIFDDTERVNSELYMQIQSGLQREAVRLGYAVRLQWTHSPTDLERMAADCAGLLIVGQHLPASLERAYATGTPIVRSGWLDPLEQADTVGGTDHEAGVAVAETLFGLGHRAVVFVHGDDRLRGRRERLGGLTAAARRMQGAVVHDLVWDERSSSFTQVFDSMLASGLRPTAFFCAHDGLALTVISEVLSRGLRIPQDVSVVGFGDFAPAQQIRPALTTVKVFGELFGVAAVRRLHTRLRQPEIAEFPLRMMIPNRIVPRASVGPAPDPLPDWRR